MWLFSTNQTSKTINVFHKTNKIAPTFRTAQCNLGVSHIFQPQPLNFFKRTNHPQSPARPWLSKLHLPGLTVQVLRVPRPSPNPFLSSLESTMIFRFLEEEFSNKKMRQFFPTKKTIWHVFPYKSSLTKTSTTFPEKKNLNPALHGDSSVFPWASLSAKGVLWNSTHLVRGL